MDEKETMLKISASPHIRSKNSTTGIMADVLIALLPATALGVWNFGIRAILLVLVCVVSCMVFEYLSELIMKRPTTVRDLSAAVTGLLLSLCLPVSLPFWMAILGSAFAIIVVKQLFGGIGQNFMNPALAGRCFLVMSFVGPMTHFTLDGITTATPLAQLRESGLHAISLKEMFLGTEAGTIGETSVAALLIGAAYLLIRRIIRLTIPLYYIFTFSVAILIYCWTQDMQLNDMFRFLLAHIFGGGLVLGAFFMATDYTTSPMSQDGKAIFGILLGILTFCFRIYGSSAEGVSYAIIICNLLVPLIEMITKPKTFGEGYEKKPMSENRGWITSVHLDENGQVIPDAKEKKGKMVRIVISICMIALLAGAMLGAVYAVTKKPIEDTAERKKQESYRAVMPDAASYSEDESVSMELLNQKAEEAGFDKVTLEGRTNAMDQDGAKLGTIWIITTHEGYAGDIKMAVGVKDGRITGVEMLSIGETTGLGMEARDNPAFRKQFLDKDVQAFSVVKTEPAAEDQIQAITGATITSKAVNGAVNTVLYMDRTEDGGLQDPEGGAEDE